MKQTTTKFYTNKMFLYGILTILFVLEYFESEENYEECHKIMTAISEVEERINSKLFTKITKENIQIVIDTYVNTFNLTGKNAVENSKHYCDLILFELNAKEDYKDFAN